MYAVATPERFRKPRSANAMNSGPSGASAYDIASQMAGSTPALDHDLLQHRTNGCRGQTNGDLDSQRLARELVRDTQETQPPTRDGLILNEVHAPDQVRALGSMRPLLFWCR